jgi:hypothetical protein
MGNMTLTRKTNLNVQWRIGALAGLAGGIAEVAWITLYAGLSGGNAVTVAKEITASVIPMAATSAIATPLGLAIHFGLAALMGIAVVVGLNRLFPRISGTAAEAGLIVLALACVWSLNFLVILPVVNPDFVHIVPMPISFTSKLLFGLVAALVFEMKKDRSKHAVKSNNY